MVVRRCAEAEQVGIAALVEYTERLAQYDGLGAVAADPACYMTITLNDGLSAGLG
jgi:hypothetical protein